MRRALAACAVVLALPGCNDQPEKERASVPAPSPVSAPQPSARTVLQFLENPAALDETWANCRNDPGGVGQTPDCANAGHAKERLMMLGRERAIESLKR